MAKKRGGHTPGMVEEARGAPDGHSDVRAKVHAATRRRMQADGGGDRLLTAEESLARCGGICLPALSLRWLIQNEAFPLGRTITLSGPFRSNKTTFAYEMARWILIYQGLAHYFSVENKDSPDLRYSICRWDPLLMEWFPAVDCYTQEHWQAGSMFFVEDLKSLHRPAKQKKKSKPGVAIEEDDDEDDPRKPKTPAEEKAAARARAAIDNQTPFKTLGIAIADTIAAAKPAGEVNTFLEKGAAGKRGYSSVALYNADWLQHAAARVSQSPAILCLVQHSNEVAVEGGYLGQTKRTQKGGGEVGFVKTTAFEMTRVGDEKPRDTWGGCTIKIQCTKNGLGPTNNYIEVPVRWWWDEQQRQHTAWDWYGASIDLLLSFDSIPGRKSTFRKLQEIVSLQKGTKGRVYSSALGVPESEQISKTAMGIRLEYDFPHLMPAIYDVLHITRRPVMELGGDLKDIWNQKIKALDVPVAPVYPRPVFGGGLESGDE